MAQPSPALLGPPELYQKPAATTTTTSSVSDPFIDLMVENFNNKALYKPPPKGLTENCSPTFLSTGNPCLDFFFHVVPDTPPETLKSRLQLAWNHDKLTALKLVCNLRGVRGTGKSDKEGFFTAALWLHENHPKTLACNVAALAEFGSFKDLLEILYRLLEGADARQLEKIKWEERKTECLTWQGEEKLREKLKNAESSADKWRIKCGFRGMGVRGKITKEGRKRLKFGAHKLSREGKRIEAAKKVVERFNRDPNFKFLHDRISDVFAQFLRSDMKLLNSGESKKISLAAKWCPSLDSSFDRMTLLCETIARKVFPMAEYPEYQGIEEAHYAYRVRDRLRKQALVPLRKVMQLPEVYIGANDWGSIPYKRVASVAMKRYIGSFFKHDEERFEAYLEAVKSGKTTIAAGALLPHEIISSLNDRGVDAEVAELQWKRMVADMAKKGELNNCLAVCDVSWSMSGVPMEVSVALGVLVSELSALPWKGKVITFSANPKLQKVKGKSLREKTEFVKEMDWGANTNFQRVFDLLLEVAVKGKLRGEDMIKRLFVFSDMEFDQASGEPWETDYKAIVRKFKKKGYGGYVPEIVFWNLRDSKATPVPGNQPGVALLSGYSKNLMTMFLEKGGDMNPEAVMEAAISGEEYQKLVVLD